MFSNDNLFYGFCIDVYKSIHNRGQKKAWHNLTCVQIQVMKKMSYILQILSDYKQYFVGSVIGVDQGIHLDKSIEK